MLKSIVIAHPLIKIISKINYEINTYSIITVVYNHFISKKFHLKIFVS